jgi:hypothetical protein
MNANGRQEGSTLYDVKLTPRQLRALAEWAEIGAYMADVRLRHDGTTITAEQGDARASWDANGTRLPA